jgi:hypothetical protein
MGFLLIQFSQQGAKRPWLQVGNPNFFWLAFSLFVVAL